MTTGKIVLAVIMFAVSVLSFTASIFQLREKGFLFNNAYIYASDEERRKMDKKLYYRQSGIIFLFVGFIFLINGIEIIIKSGWLFYIVMLTAVVVIVYAVVSSVKIDKLSKEEKNDKD